MQLRQRQVCSFAFGLADQFRVSWAFMLTTMGATKPVCAVCGVVASVFVGFIKEVVDFFRDKPFDAKDWLFTVIGGIIGAVLYMM